MRAGEGLETAAGSFKREHGSFIIRKVIYVRGAFNIPSVGKFKDARYPRDGGSVLAKIWGQKENMGSKKDGSRCRITKDSPCELSVNRNEHPHELLAPRVPLQRGRRV